jgi:cation-transporting ATPase 13A3/4/5
MSVVCKIGTGNEVQHVAYAKGSPEIMVTIMDKKSVPSNYSEVLKEYTSNGFRVLAIASKKVEGNIKALSRDEAESNL